MAASIDALVRARQSGTRIEALPATPSSVAEAHTIQDNVAKVLGESVGAFKANAPPGEEPVRGLIYARMIRRSPARIAPVEVPHLGVEGEIAFRFIRDLAPRSVPYSREEVAGSVVALPAVEVVSGRFRDPRSRPSLEQLADCLINGALVPGPEMHDWSHLEMSCLRVVATVNGEPVLARQGSHPTGDPLGPAVALVNMMNEAVGVKAGQLVTTGSWTGLMFLRPGDHFAVEFDALGRAEVVFGT